MKAKQPISSFFRHIFYPSIHLLERIFGRIGKSLRLELIIAFALCLLAYLVVYHVAGELFAPKYAYIDYSQGQEAIDQEGRLVVERLMALSTEADPLPNLDHARQIQEFINKEADLNKVKILLTDLDGIIIMKSENAPEKEIDLYTIIGNAMKTRINQGQYFPGLIQQDSRQEFYSFYPAVFQSAKVYVVVSGSPQASINYIKGGTSLAVIYGLVAFIAAFFLLTRGKMRYIEELAKGLLEISKGNLNYRVAEKSEDELGSLANNINHMANELKTKIERERQVERAKNELITNVSHDLRTPLTSIMGYLRLLKDKKFETEQQQDNYVEIAYGKSEKLKVLMEDLFEYTKLTNEPTQLERHKVAMNDLLEQLIEELVPICEENELAFVMEFPQERVLVELDSDKVARVFENLLMNAIKYSHKPGEILVHLSKENDWVTVKVQNYGEPIPPEDLKNLFERFYRVEKSRSSQTGGSGLGLAIAKNIVDIHGGKIWAECEGELISFFVQFKISMEPEIAVAPEELTDKKSSASKAGNRKRRRE